MRIGIVSWFNPSVISDLLYPNQNIPNINVGVASVNTITREMILQGHEVVVFTYGSIHTNTILLQGNGVKVYVLNDYGIRGISNLNRIYMIGKLKKVIALEIETLDVLHAHWTYDFALAAKSFVKKVPVFCSVRDWCPYIMKMQTTMKYKILWKLYYLVFKLVMKGNDVHFIANSDYTYNQIHKSYPDKQIDIIPNPILKDYILPKKIKKVDHPSFIAICQGIGNKRKNYDRLLEAFKSFKKTVPEATLKLVGSGFESGNPIVEKWRSHDLLDGVELYGFVPHSDLMALIDESTCLIHPSLEETFGNILLEGMARYIPVIGGDHSGAVPQVLGFGKYGILCNVYSIDSIVEAMGKSLDKKFVDLLVKKANEYLSENYASDAVVNQHINLFTKFVKQ